MTTAGALLVKLMLRYLADAHIRVAWSQLVGKGWVKETSA